MAGGRDWKTTGRNVLNASEGKKSAKEIEQNIKLFFYN